MNLKDAVAVVTGASRGIGKAAAIALAREGAHVVCTARSSEATPSRLPGTIDEVARQIEALGRRALAVPCDVTHDAQVEALVQRTLAEFSRIDILINNAGITPPARFAKMPMRLWDLVLGVNLRGAALCTRAFLPQMLQQQSGRIINVSSGIVSNLGHVVQWGIIPYFVSKVGVEALTQALALELQPKHIAVNCLRIEMIIPTEGWRDYYPDEDISSMEKPESAAEAIFWLAARELPYTGHVVTVSEAQWALAREA
jgi:NAD(P)-dependent dehydrogenase (short-subunit alcohol dehydrogenase family)